MSLHAHLAQQMCGNERMAHHFVSRRMLTATAMANYQDELAKALVLALFLPLIISSGGNSGSQASTL